MRAGWGRGGAAGTLFVLVQLPLELVEVGHGGGHGAELPEPSRCLPAPPGASRSLRAPLRPRRLRPRSAALRHFRPRSATSGAARLFPLDSRQRSALPVGARRFPSLLALFRRRSSLSASPRALPPPLGAFRPRSEFTVAVLPFRSLLAADLSRCRSGPLGAAPRRFRPLSVPLGPRSRSSTSLPPEHAQLPAAAPVKPGDVSHAPLC